MTRQHFEALANALKDAKPWSEVNLEAIHQWRHDVRLVAGACAKFNPNFNLERFYKACGLEV